MKTSLPLVVVALSATTATAAVPATAAAATKYTGSTTSFKYGKLRVAIGVSDKKITGISVSYTPTDPRSLQIDEASLPTLKRETLKTQTWKVHSVSGATYTTAAFQKSLYSAMGHANLLKK